MLLHNKGRKLEDECPYAWVVSINVYIEKNQKKNFSPKIRVPDCKVNVLCEIRI